MILRLRRCLLSGFVFLVALTSATCRRHGPADVSSDVTLEIVNGDGQFGPTSQFLIDSLTVAVRTEDGGIPADGILLEWKITAGAMSAQLTPRTSPSDPSGLARARLRLGSDLGQYVIRASVRDRPEEFVEFEAWAVLPPTLEAISATTANAGEVITVSGVNFSAIAAHNVVLFSGIAGRVIDADPVRLDVIVPPCLPTRSVDVSVQLGGESSTSVALEVTASAGVLELAVGADIAISGPETPTCVRLGGVSRQEYLVVVQSTATIGAARFDYTLTGLRPDAASVALGSGDAARGRGAAHLIPRIIRPRNNEAREGGDSISAGEWSLNEAQADWDLFLREQEGRLWEEEGFVRVSRSPSGGAARVSPRALPGIGESMEFEVVRADGGFDQVNATVRLVSERAILYEDRTAEGSLSQQDIELFAGLFDDPIYPVDTGTFGHPSDLDENGRVIILFTPSVNRRSPLGSNDFVGGFFYGLDLMPELEHSNGGEIFYVHVPDPTGEFGRVRSAELIRASVPSILAHEFQHMIHFNERMIVRRAPHREALWLAEGLAHMAEDLVGEELRRRGRVSEADQYQIGNRGRASLFLTEPSDVSLIMVAGNGTLEERGAAWLFLEYLRGQAGGNDVLTSLTGSTLTGTVNVASTMGGDWADLFSNWSAALELERQALERVALPLRDELRVLAFDLMAALELGGGGFPSPPMMFDSGDFSEQGRLWSASGAYYLVQTGGSGVALGLAGPRGGPVSRNSGLQLKLVRLF